MDVIVDNAQLISAYQTKSTTRFDVKLKDGTIVQCITWGKLGNVIMDYLDLGDSVGMVGKLRDNKIWVNTIEILHCNRVMMDSIKECLRNLMRQQTTNQPVT